MKKSIFILSLTLVLMLFLHSCQKETLVEKGIQETDSLSETSSAQISTNDFQEMESVIQAYFNTKYGILTGKDGNLKLNNENSLEELRANEQKETKQLKNNLAEKNIIYDNYVTEIVINKSDIKIIGNYEKVKILVIESTKLNKIGDEKNLGNEFEDDHIFTLIRRNNKWLVSQAKRKIFASYSANEEIHDSIPKVSHIYDLKNGPIKVKDSNNHSYKNNYYGTTAANYALNHTCNNGGFTNTNCNYNDDYYFYSNNDCTNFVSQALYAGGWEEDLGYYKSYNAWWYNGGNFPPYASYTWSGAHNFYWFTNNSGRGTLASYFSQASVGDVIQMDFQRDGYIDHTMIVTKIQNGYIYLSGHTANRKDYALNNYLNNPSNNWNYYLWRL